MDFLSSLCQSCNKPMNGGVYKSPLVCPHCGFDHDENKASALEEAPSQVMAEPETQAESAVEEVMETDADITQPRMAEDTPEASLESEQAQNESSASDAPAAPKQEVIRTAKDTAPAYEVSELEPASVKLSNDYPTDKLVSAQLGDLSENSEISFALTPAMVQDGKFVGAKSPEVKDAMKKARAKALNQIRNSAAMSGANMVANIETNYGLKAVDAKTVKVTAKVTGEALAVEEADEYGLA